MCAAVLRVCECLCTRIESEGRLTVRTEPSGPRHAHGWGRHQPQETREEIENGGFSVGVAQRYPAQSMDCELEKENSDISQNVSTVVSPPKKRKSPEGARFFAP